MKPKFKATPNTVLILCLLAMAVIINLIMTLVNTQKADMAVINTYRQIILPLNILDFLKAGIILFMGFSVFRITKNVIAHAKWQPGFYYKIKQIGWLSVLVLLLHAITTVAHEQYIYKNESLTNLWGNPGFYQDVISSTLFSSPLAWFLVLCIFLLADVLKYTYELKTDSESII